MKGSLFYSILLIALMPLAGGNMACSGAGLFLGARRYSTAFANDTDVMFHDVKATRADDQVLWAIAGMLCAGGEEMSNDVPDPIPVRVIVSWKTPDGLAHEQSVELAGKIPNAASFTGGIWFVFTDKGVKLVTKADSYWLRIHRGPMANVPDGPN